MKNRLYNYPGRKGFTLIEFIAVVVIVAMAVGVVIGRVGKIPADLLIEQVAAQIEVLMREASNRSVMQGKVTSVEYDPDQRLFSVATDINGYAERVIAENFTEYSLPDGVLIEAVDGVELLNGDGVAVFDYYPDGSGSGPALLVKLKAHTRKLEISPLTGMVLITDEN